MKDREFSMEYLFPYPVILYNSKDSECINDKLKKIIIDKMKSSKGDLKTSRGGWQSEKNLHLWPERAIEVLTERISTAIEAYSNEIMVPGDVSRLGEWKIQFCWGNINRRGAFNQSHDHYGPHSLFSGIYYVDVGTTSATNEGLSGQTVFEDRSGIPREIPDGTTPSAREFRFTPRAGSMVIFPASLYHRVEPYEGDGFRITISFNLYHSGFRNLAFGRAEGFGFWWRNFRGLMILPQKVPEKLYALWTLPRIYRERRRLFLGSEIGFRDCLRDSFDRATAEASERTQNR